MTDVLVLVYWTENATTGRTGGHSQPAGLPWPAGVPLPVVGDKLYAPQGASPLNSGTVRVIDRTWEWSWDSCGYVVILRLDCEWEA